MDDHRHSPIVIVFVCAGVIFMLGMAVGFVIGAGGW
jgi:hypothetical protein